MGGCKHEYKHKKRKKEKTYLQPQVCTGRMDAGGEREGVMGESRGEGSHASGPGMGKGGPLPLGKIGGHGGCRYRGRQQLAKVGEQPRLQT